MRFQDGFLGDCIGPDLNKKQLAKRIKRSVNAHRIAWFVTWEIEVEVISELAEMAGVDWLYSDDTGEARFFEFM
jgi:hypothetical protein